MRVSLWGISGYDATESAIRELFEAHGTVGRINLVRDRDTGAPRGFAFVEMANNAEADRAIAGLNGVNLGGNALNVNEARPKTNVRATNEDSVGSAGRLLDPDHGDSNWACGQSRRACNAGHRYRFNIRIG